ncbi:MAG: Origin recognition complex subunit 2 [Bathelium mastoideum]|nr:MAG: Origin recognition complex subunit 2 [Bathelium mastoideum]
MAKRRRADAEPESNTSTPKKPRTSTPEVGAEDGVAVAATAATTPSGRTRGRPPGSASKRTPKSALKVNGRTTSPSTRTPKSERRVLFSKPAESDHDTTPQNKTSHTKSPLKAVDRSAHKKSARRLLQQTVSDDISDEDDLAQEELLARQIRGEDEQEDDVEAEDEANEALEALKELGQDQEIAPDTPSKRGRGRPKGSRKKRSPTPPSNLPPHEQYFFQNRPGGTKTSNNTLSSALLLDHEEYFAQIRDYADPHEADIQFLHDLHTRSFPQWSFELAEGFNLCLYGWGSKRTLALDFAKYLQQNPSPATSPPPKVIVVNGYNTSLTLRDILHTIATNMPSLKNTKLPSHPPALLSLLLSHLSPPHPFPSPSLILLVHSVDAPSLRRPSIHAALASIAAARRIPLILTADTPTFPLLWDHATLSALRLVHHDATTWAPFTAELDVVGEVQSLLGRGGKRGLGGRAGVGFVLRSLTENARGLFRVLVKEQLTAEGGGVASALGEGEGDGGEAGGGFEGMIGGPDGDAFGSSAAPSLGPMRKRRRDTSEMDGGIQGGVEYRVLYHKAVEEFICSSEHAFRTLLKEFYDHQMVESRKDGMGTEMLYVPFRREELEGLLEEITA